MVVLRFPRRIHARASIKASEVDPPRAANLVSASAVKPASTAVGESRIAFHHSEGMLSRNRHLRAAATPAPISDAMASGEGQSPITARKEDGSLMPSLLGHSVLKVKDDVSRDDGGQSVLLSGMDKTQSDIEFKKAFTGRIKAAREAKGLTQRQMAKLLGLEQDHYKQFEGRTLMPHGLIPIFCDEAKVDISYLFNGPRVAVTKSRRKAG